MAANPYSSEATLKLSDAQKQRLRAQVHDEYLSDKDARRSWSEDMALLQKTWQGNRGPTRKTSPWPGCSNVDVPLTAIVVEGMHAALFEGYFSQRPFIRFKEAPYVESFIEWEIDREMDARPTFDEYLLNVCIFGTAVGYVYPTKNRHGKFALRLENISNIDDFFIPEHYCGRLAIKEAHHVGLRRYMKVWEALDRRRRGEWEGVEAADGSGVRFSGSESSLIEKEKRTLEKIETATIPYRDKLQNEICIVEWYTKFQMGREDGTFDEDEEPIDIIAWVAVDPVQKVYRVVENKQNIRPFFHSVLHPVPGRFHGLGEPKRLKQLQDQLNLIYNMRNDAGQIAIQPPVYFDPASGLKPEEVHAGPGVHVPTMSPGDVKIAQPTGLPSHMYEEENQIVAYVERLTGVSDLILGQRAAGSDTATEARAALQQGSMRTDVAMRRIGWGLGDFVMLTIRWNKLLRDDGVKIRVIGTAEDVTLSKTEMADWSEDYVPQFDVNSLTGNRAAEREGMLMLYDKLMANPLFVQDPNALFGSIQLLANAFTIRRPEQVLPKMYFEKLREQRMSSTAPQENEEMAQGRAAEADWYDDHAAHLTEHDKLRRVIHPELREIVVAHMRQHSYFLRLQQMGAVTGESPTVELGAAMGGAAAPGSVGGGTPTAPFAPGASPETVGGAPVPGMQNIMPEAIQQLGRPAPVPAAPVGA